MSEINKIDLKCFITNSVNKVFDTMLSMSVEFSDADFVMDGERIVGSVSFAGKVMGVISINVGNTFAREMTAAMLGMETDEIESDEEVFDVIGEVSNMIGGDLKSRFCDAGLDCQLSIPTTTSGSNFKIDLQGWIKHESLIFYNGTNSASVEVYVKNAS